MFTSRILTGGALAALLAAPALATVDTIARIDATVDLTAVQNAEAAAYWANLEADLEEALAARLVDRIPAEEVRPDDNGDIDGTRISVDIRAVELANAFDRALNLGDAVLVGQVNVADDTETSNADAYELSVSLETASIVVPEGSTVILSSDTAGTYQRLVDTFADGVVSRLK